MTMPWQRRSQRDFEDEIRSHIEIETDRLIAEGVPAREAFLAAKRAFGNVGRAQDRYHDAGRFVRLESVARDLRHAARRLLHAPVFALSAIVTLALGIGGAVAAFTVVNAVLLRPLPYDNAEQLADVTHTLRLSGNTMRVDVSDATYLLYHRDQHLFTEIGMHVSRDVNLAAATPGQATSSTARVSAAALTASVLRVLGVRPTRGRGLADADGEPGAPGVALIGFGLWQRVFAGDANIVGKRISVDGVTREIVGVMPPDFHFPEAQTALWLPLEIDAARTRSAAFDFHGIGRLRSGITAAAAENELSDLLPRVPEVYPGRLTKGAITMTHMRVSVRPLRDVIVGDSARSLWIVLGAVCALLLLACANVANLFLARAEARQHEIAVRRALGASRGALFADIVAESVLLAVLGGVLGLSLAAVGMRVLQTMDVGAAIPRLVEVHVDAFAVAVTALVSAVAALVVGGLPALRGGAKSLSSVLVSEGPRAAGGRHRQRARRALVVSQMALALVLLAAAGLFARSFARLRAVDPGFVAEHALAFRLALPEVAYPSASDASQVIARTLDGLRSLHGVQLAGAITKLPLDPEAKQDSAVFVEDHPLGMGAMPNIHAMAFATPEYFGAMHIPLVAGHLFSTLDPGRDVSQSAREVVVSEAFARKYWSSATAAVGRRIRMNFDDPWSTIIGVVGSVRDDGLTEAAAEAVYSPMITMSHDKRPWTPHDVAFVVRSSGDPTLLTAEIAAAVRATAPAVPLFRVIPVSALAAEATARTTFTLMVLAIAAALALLIGAVGLYGVTAYLVSLQRREIGVRVALGAQSSDVHKLVLGRALTDTIIGVVLGLVGAAATTKMLAATLFGVSPVDPLTLGAAAVLLVVTAIVAAVMPARRAAALDPAMSLRMD